jgi:hypothetical protein
LFIFTQETKDLQKKTFGGKFLCRVRLNSVQTVTTNFREVYLAEHISGLKNAIIVADSFAMSVMDPMVGADVPIAIQKKLATIKRFTGLNSANGIPLIILIKE